MKLVHVTGLCSKQKRCQSTAATATIIQRTTLFILPSLAAIYGMQNHMFAVMQMAMKGVVLRILKLLVYVLCIYATAPSSTLREARFVNRASIRRCSIYAIRALHRGTTASFSSSSATSVFTKMTSPDLEPRKTQGLAFLRLGIRLVLASGGSCGSEHPGLDIVAFV